MPFAFAPPNVGPREGQKSEADSSPLALTVHVTDLLEQITSLSTNIIDING